MKTEQQYDWIYEALIDIKKNLDERMKLLMSRSDALNWNASITHSSNKKRPSSNV